MPPSRPRPPMGLRAISATVLYALLFVLTVGGILARDERLMLAAIAVSLPYIALIVQRGIWRNVAVGVVLTTVGALITMDSGKAVTALIEGAEKTLPILVMFGASLTLRYPALHSPSMTSVGHWIAGQPKGRRFLVVSLASLAFGWVLNQAAIVLMISFIRLPVGSEAHRRMMHAIIRGFIGAVTWSPLFVGMAIVLPLVPGATWLKVAPMGILITATIIGAAFLVDRLTRSRGDTAEAPPAPPPVQAGPAMRRVAGIFLALAAGVVYAFEVHGVPITIAIGIVAPPIAIAWQWLVLRGAANDVAETPRQRLRPFGRHLLSIGPSLGSETVLFLGANILGVGAALALDPAAVAFTVDLLPDSLVLRSAAMILIGTSFAFVGLHPVVFIVLVGEAFSAEILGMTPTLLASILLTVWGMGAAASPFSAVSMHMSRMTKQSPYRIAWVWTGPFVVAMAVILGPLLVAFHDLFN